MSVLAPHMEAVARRLLGDPNPALSTPQELRYGNRGSLSIDLKKGTWFDHEAGTGGGVLSLIEQETSANGEAAEWLRNELEVELPANAKQPVAEFDYRDENGALLFQVVRFEPKDFRQRRPDGAGGWQWKLDNVRRVPYRLPEILDAGDRIVFIAEGEKAVHALERLGLLGTCSPGGAGKWRDEFSAFFRGADVAILPDNDNAGRNHARQVAAKLCGVAARVRIVDLPDLPSKGDAADWVAAGGTAEELERLLEAAAESREETTNGKAETTEANAPTPKYSDDALAQRFSNEHGDDLRYVAKWGRWLRWDGCRWQFDDTLAVYDLTRVVCREIAVDCDNPHSAKVIASGKTIAAVERLAKADRRHAATVDQWDTDPWLLNTPTGTVDLRTGQVRAHRREDFITHVTPVAPGEGCPTWTSFLERVTDGNDELQLFLQRIVGYALTGITREHALFFVYGTGANGKSVFINTIIGILGEYHRTAPMEVFVASHSDRHPTELAMLRGARLVTAVETEEGRRWAESRIKSLTGGDKISARFMRQDFFEITPQFKLLVAGNHKPSLRSVDEAIRRRLHLIPFTVTIPPEERDELLTDKLRDEWPGILAWAIEGAAQWGMTGLQPPERVREATDNYLSEEDAIIAWIDECCERDPNCWEKTSDLFDSWKVSAERSGEYVGTLKAFSQTLAARDFQRERRMDGRGFNGLRIKRPDYTDDPRTGG